MTSRTLASILFAVAFATGLLLPCDGVRLYPEAEYRGVALPLVESVKNLHLWSFGDEGESLLVPGGCRVVFYEERRFEGRSFEVVGPAFSADLNRGGWADRISSLELFPTEEVATPALRGREIQWEAPVAQHATDTGTDPVVLQVAGAL